MKREAGEDPDAGPKGYASRVVSWLADLRSYLQMTGGSEIARRYIAMNGFDGISTALGVVLGLALGGASDPGVVVNACFGAGVAMGVSGLWGAYIAERAERRRAMDELENHMKHDLSGSVLERASTATAVLLSLVDGLAAGIPALVPAIPFMFTSWGWIAMETAVNSAIVLCVVLLFLLGVYVGRVSGENPLLHGVLMVCTGVVIVVLLSLLLPGNSIGTG